MWYVLLAVRTMAIHSAATYDRFARLARFLPETARAVVADVADRFEMVQTMADGQREFLHGVIEFYQKPHLHTYDYCVGEISLAGRPTKRGHAPDHGMGRDRRCANRRNKLFRPERALPRRRDRGRRGRRRSSC